MRTAALLAVGVLLLSGCDGFGPTPSPQAACPTGPPTVSTAQSILEGADRAVVTVSGGADGQFTIQLHADEAPISTANFVALARCGFYDGIKFHRVLDGFVIQAGDPNTERHEADFEGIGSGGPGYDFEIEPPNEGLTYDPYSVSMANNRTAQGSQFFIALADLDDRLPRTYTIFGQVSEGTDVIDAIAKVPVNDPRLGVPLDPVTIDSIVIEAGED